MARIICTQKTFSFRYDATVDNPGTVPGQSAFIGIFIPGNAIVVYGFAKVITSFAVDSGNPTISVGTSGSPGSQAFVAQTNHASWTAGAILEGVDLIRNMVEVPARQVIVRISAGVLSAGVIVYFGKYIEIYE